MFKKILEQLVKTIKKPTTPDGSYRPSLFLMFVFATAIGLFGFQDRLGHNLSLIPFFAAMGFLGAWFLTSERYLKTNAKISIKINFILDEIFFLGPQTALIYLTGGFDSHLRLALYILAIISVASYYPQYLSLANIAVVSSINLFFYFFTGPTAHNLETLFFETMIIAFAGITLSKVMDEIKMRGLLIAQNAKLKTSFITTVSHQMRTPVSSIRWNLETLLDGGAGSLKNDQKEILQNSYTATKEIISRLNDLLMALDAGSGHVQMEQKEILLPEILDPLWSAFAKQCKLKKIKTEFSNPGTPPPIKVDPGKTSYVFQKILDNALAYTKPGGKITAAVAHAENKIRFEVSDTGVGIPEKDQPQIFNVFFRASNAARMLPDASGLGLYLAKYYTELEGGRIGFQSVEKRGSTFWVEFPTENI